MDAKSQEAPVEATYVTDHEALLRETMSNAADARDMARMGKPQEMKVK